MDLYYSRINPLLIKGLFKRIQYKKNKIMMNDSANILTIKRELFRIDIRRK